METLTLWSPCVNLFFKSDFIESEQKQKIKLRQQKKSRQSRERQKPGKQIEQTGLVRERTLECVCKDDLARRERRRHRIQTHRHR